MTSEQAATCPVDHSKYNKCNYIPKDLDQEPQSDQAQNLDKNRQVSSIPKNTGENWIYPSQQQFFNALAKKGKETAEEDVEMIIAIHNSMNEQTWQQIQHWEQTLHPQCTPRLLRFKGRPDDLSPKARVYNLLGWAPLPFDRHDWTVQRCDKEVRYVIDYYDGGSDVMHVDVRPAIDSFETLMDRVSMLFK